MNNLLAIGAIVNSALYLTGIFVAALAWHSPVALYLALAAAGLSFLSYSFALWPEGRTAHLILSPVSSAIGLFAGLALVVAR